MAESKKKNESPKQDQKQSPKKGDLTGLNVAILATEGVEQVELVEPRKALEAAGANVRLVSPKDEVQMFNHHDRGDKIEADVKLSDADADDFDALVLPGGVINPDVLRTDPKAVEFVRAFSEADKPIASICHGPWMLVEAGVAKGHRLTSWPSLKTDITNAGGEWTDETMVRDGKLVTSRNPKDIPNFNRGMIELFSESRATGATAKKPSTREKRSEAPSAH